MSTVNCSINHSNHSNHSVNYMNRTSYKNITLTPHSMLRAYERLNVTTKDEVRKIACQAKYNGININSLTIHSYESKGITYPELVAIKNNYFKMSNTEKIYYYKDKLFCFRGKNAYTLVSILPIHINKNLEQPVFN